MIAATAAIAGGALAGAAQAAKRAPRTVGHVYVSTNAEAGNAVVVFDRLSNGLLKQGGVYPTGGRGAGGNPELPLPIADSDGPLALSPDGRVLFVGNLGSNTVTSFRVRGGSLVRVTTVGSGGVTPNAVDAQHGLMYVANARSSTMTGFRYDSRGRLRPIANAARTLGENSLPASLRIDPQGKYLAVTERAANQTVVYPLNAAGQAGTPVAFPSAGAHPFALELTSNDLMLTGDEGNFPMAMGDSRLTSYDTGGATTPIDSQPDSETATCWIVLSGNERYGYATSAVSGGITSFSLTKSGQIRVLGRKGVVNGTVATDAARSVDSKYLYVLAIDADLMRLSFKSAHIEVFRLSSNGAFTRIGVTPAALPGSVSGLKAR